MADIIKMERERILQLSRSLVHIDGFVKRAEGFIAMKLRENKFCLFGSLKVIQGLHQKLILPQMLGAANGKCVDFIQILVNLIDDGHFYCYVSHKMLERSMKKLHGEHLLMIKTKVDTSNPFDMLEIYRDWITNICNELMKHPTRFADDIAVCMEAEKKMNELIDVVTDAGAVSRIIQISETPTDVQFKVYSIIRKHDDDILHEPMLLLIPKKNQKFSYRYPVRISKASQRNSHQTFAS